jgi:hypothetical protein
MTKFKDVLKFKNPVNEQKASERYVLIEDRDSRVLVTEQKIFNTSMFIKPTIVFLKSDMIVCN